MAGPWEKYQTADETAPTAATEGPWAKYSGAPPKSSVSDYAAGFGGGFNVGLAKTLGAPVDLANAALGTVGLDSERPIGGSRFIQENLPEELFYQGPDDTLGRGISRVGEEIGATALPAAAITRAATKARAIPAAVGEGGSVLGRAWDAFLQPIRRTPARASAGELAAATGAGAGAAVAEEHFPGDVGAEMTGQVVGGLAPGALAVTPTGAALNVANRLGRYVSGQASARRGAKAVKQTLGHELTPEAQAELTRAQELRRRMPGFDPTIGEATGSPALLATQRDLESRASGRDLERFIDRRRTSRQAVERFAEQAAPRGAPEPAYVVDAATGEINSLRRAFDAEGQQVAREAEELAGRLPRADQTNVGQTIRDAVSNQRAQTSSEMSDLAASLGLNDQPVMGSSDDLQARFKGLFTDRSIFDDPTKYPRVLDTILDMEPGKPVTFGDLKALRERLSDDIRDAMVGSPSGKKVRPLVVMKAEVDKIIDDLAGQTPDPELAARYQQFRDTYRSDYVNVFEQGAMFKVRETNSQGFYKTQDEQVAAQFFKPGNITSARQFNSVFAGNDEAMAALEAHAMDSLRDFAVRDGKIDPRRLDSWRRIHRNVLDEFPALQAKVDDVAESSEALFSRQQDLAQRAALVENQFLTKALARLETTAGQTPEDVILGALAEPRMMAQLKSVVSRRPEAMNALRRVVWDMASSGKSEDMLNFMARHNASMKQVFGEKHLSDLVNIAAARAMAERTPRPKGRATTVRPLQKLERLIGQGLPQLSSRFFAFNAGRMQKGYLVTESALRSLRGRAAIQADELFKEALYDPAVARELMDAIDAGGLTQKGATRLYARLFALGLTPLHDEGDD